MVRYLFPGDVIVTNNSGDAYLGVNLGFTVWTDRVSGTDVSSQMRAPDGVTIAALVSDANGLRPALNGPDGNKGPLWCDTGAAQRFPMYAADAIQQLLASGGGSGVTAHSGLSGLGADDHTQYHNDARGDIRYYTKTAVDSLVSSAASAQSSADRSRQNHTGTQALSTIDTLLAELAKRPQAVVVSTGAEARPAGSSVVTWVCPTGVTPANAISGDIIYSPTTGTAPSDTTAPSTPTGLAASAITSTGFTVSWTASTDNVGVANYQVELNGSVLAQTYSSTSAALTGLTASTTYAVRVRARDAAGNASAWSSSLSVTTGSSGGTVEHNVFGATAHPGTATKATDGPVTVATAGYTFSSASNGWRAVGGRLYVPAGIAVPSSCAISLWIAGSGVDLSATPARTATLSGITAGQWNEVRFASPLQLTPGAVFWIGYRFADGSYLTFGNPGNAGIKSNNTDYLYIADGQETNDRGRFRYDNGNANTTDNLWGLDIIVDQGAV